MASSSIEILNTFLNGLDTIPEEWDKDTVSAIQSLMREGKLTNTNITNQLDQLYEKALNENT